MGNARALADAQVVMRCAGGTRLVSLSMTWIRRELITWCHRSRDVGCEPVQQHQTNPWATKIGTV